MPRKKKRGSDLARTSKNAKKCRLMGLSQKSVDKRQQPDDNDSVPDISSQVSDEQSNISQNINVTPPASQPPQSHIAAQNSQNLSDVSMTPPPTPSQSDSESVTLTPPPTQRAPCQNARNVPSNATFSERPRATIRTVNDAPQNPPRNRRDARNRTVRAYRRRKKAAQPGIAKEHNFQFFRPRFL